MRAVMIGGNVCQSLTEAVYVPRIIQHLAKATKILRNLVGTDEHRDFIGKAEGGKDSLFVNLGRTSRGS